jgi:hypothetical protein
MRDLEIAVLVFCLLFGGALLGMYLRRRLPAEHLSTESKDSVRIGMASVATMAAMLLGLLVASSKSTYDNQKREIIEISAKVISLDEVLANYGPAASEDRQILRSALESATDRIWSTRHDAMHPSSAWSRQLPQAIQRLDPQNEAQGAFKAQAAQLASQLAQERWLLLEESESSIPPLLLVVIVCWLVILSISVGLFAPFNATVVAAQLLAALSIAGAIFVILQLNHPFGGIMRISSESIRGALGHLAG